MDERTLLELIGERLEMAGDDAAVIGEHVLTIDMLHERADFPPGTTRYTMGWRTIGVSLSDIAAMGAAPQAAVGVYGAPTLARAEIESFLDGAEAVCGQTDCQYVGGDLDQHQELTVVGAVFGATGETDPVYRSGANIGDRVCVTGTLGRSAAAVSLFETGAHERANDLFQFQPRVSVGQQLAPYATAMIDSSDGLVRSIHQLAEASGHGIAIESDRVPLDPAVDAVAATNAEREQLGLFFGGDFELVCTIPSEQFSAAQAATTAPLTDIGTVTETGVQMDGNPLPDQGYDHGEDEPANTG